MIDARIFALVVGLLLVFIVALIGYHRAHIADLRRTDSVAFWKKTALVHSHAFVESERKRAVAEHLAAQADARLQRIIDGLKHGEE